MKGNFISQSKMSKKARKALCKEQRVMWDFSPATRTETSKKAYNRKRKHRHADDSMLSLFAAWRAA
ncbi:MAG: hypothetical protein IJD60_11035 [Clostridia bacterium]|nr:hypothetical protein [Clostridia bacterium]